jgi:toxin ParE1/3/4
LHGFCNPCNKGIHRDKPSAALSFRQKTEKSLSLLKKFPESGRPLPEFPELPFREVIVKPYRFFYTVKDNDVWVVAVWQGAQLPDEPEN